MDMDHSYSGTATFETEKAERYIAQLCKHFAHKVEVKYSQNEGWAALPGSEAFMKAENGSLQFKVFSQTEEGYERGKYIIEDHIVRFAFREKLDGLYWKEIPAS
ncbi:MAG: DUF2218 domain-containing protein [Pseudomonadota bacterium]